MLHELDVLVWLIGTNFIPVYAVDGAQAMFI